MNETKERKKLTYPIRACNQNNGLFKNKRRIRDNR